MANKPILFTARTDGSAVPTGYIGEEKIHTATIAYVAASGAKTVAKVENIGKGVWEISGLVFVNASTGAGKNYGMYISTVDNGSAGSVAGLSQATSVVGSTGEEYGTLSFPPFNIVVTSDTESRYLVIGSTAISASVAGTLRLKRVG